MSYSGGNPPPNLAEQMRQFLAISSALTGFALEILAPALDPVDLKTTYFEKVSNDSRWLALLQKAEEHGFSSLHRDQQEHLLGEWINAGSGPLETLGIPELLRLITKLWYLGTWYGGTVPLVLTDQTYKHGLAWKVMLSHPMGYSQDPFGAWSEDPRYDLSDATGGVVHSSQGQGSQS